MVTNQNNTQVLLVEFLVSGGVVTKCKPKLAPRKRSSSKKINTVQQTRTILGYRPLTNYKGGE